MVQTKPSFTHRRDKDGEKRTFSKRACGLPSKSPRCLFKCCIPTEAGAWGPYFNQYLGNTIVHQNLRTNSLGLNSDL